MLRHLPLALILLVAFSGCAETANKAGDVSASAGPTDAGPGAPVPKTGLGAIVVVVTTTELLPVAAAQVVLAGTEIATFTDEGGRAVINDLEPAAYTVVTAKPGFRPLQPKGRVVQVQPDAVTDAKLELDPVPVVDKDSSYHLSFPFRGFIACSVEWKPPTNPQGARTHPCRGVPVQGQMVGRDPNENSIHAWKVDNIQVQTIIMEALWKPSYEALGSNLYVSSLTSYQCTATACTVNNEFIGGGGSSPLYVSRSEGGQQNLTSRLGREPGKYPRDVWSEVRAWCPTGCQASLTLQQKYDLWLSVFYGQEAPEGYTVVPG